ncbi:MAG TPA: nucleotidyl transferase AbiEii/AbiGii toxin family protein [Candidatus Baltobacteraceae bacterium]|nr:nucleotidyl transferase AbiEii/AbiGii toxin family protein [Candidatus Baltobacteraceae bacterium]
MDSFARLPSRDRREAFEELARRRQIEFTMVEKDFWVCWVLKSIFDLPHGHPTMTFKGGTSLSKAYGLIDRFSEDIDVVTDPGFFIAQGIATPEEAGISRPQRKKRMAELDVACGSYIKGLLLNELRKQFAFRLDSSDDWSIGLDPTDPHALLFAYPRSNPEHEEHPYVRRFVKIELGWRAKSAPSETRSIEPYLADIPFALQNPIVACNVLAPDRTFWEKVTALHAESFRDGTKPFFARHYSDVATMLQTRTGKNASYDLAMLEDVRAFKEVYYYSAWAHYDLAKPGSLVVVPNAKKLRDLAGDYNGMEQMFLHDPPSFDWVVEQLRSFEAEINK